MKRLINISKDVKTIVILDAAGQVKQRQLQRNPVIAIDDGDTIYIDRATPVLRETPCATLQTSSDGIVWEDSEVLVWADRARDLTKTITAAGGGLELSTDNMVFWLSAGLVSAGEGERVTSVTDRANGLEWASTGGAIGPLYAAPGPQFNGKPSFYADGSRREDLILPIDVELNPGMSIYTNNYGWTLRIAGTLGSVSVPTPTRWSYEISTRNGLGSVSLQSLYSRGAHPSNVYIHRNDVLGPAEAIDGPVTSRTYIMEATLTANGTSSIAGYSAGSLMDASMDPTDYVSTQSPEGQVQRLFIPSSNYSSGILIGNDGGNSAFNYTDVIMLDENATEEQKAAVVEYFRQFHAA